LRLTRTKRDTDALSKRARALPEDASRSEIRPNLFARAARRNFWNTPRSVLLGEGLNTLTRERGTLLNADTPVTQPTLRLLRLMLRAGCSANARADEPVTDTLAGRNKRELNTCRGDDCTVGLRRNLCTTHSLTRERTVYSEDSLCVPRMIWLSRGSVTTRGHNFDRRAKFR
jgi:hypothetical protein